MDVEIRVSGQIDEHWSSWFEDLEIGHDQEQDQTLLCGEIADQAALYGLLAKLRDLGLGLLSVHVERHALVGGPERDEVDREETQTQPADPGPS
jgi:hypothetical protein